MSMRYAYWVETLREYFEPGAYAAPFPEISNLNGSCPVDKISATILFDLMRGPWNRQIVVLETDGCDFPWTEASGWRDVCTVHKDLVRNAIQDVTASQEEHARAEVER